MECGIPNLSTLAGWARVSAMTLGLACLANPAVAGKDRAPNGATASPSEPIRTEVGAVDPAARYLIYLHAKIVEDRGLPARDETHGEYRYREILEALAGQGFVVISEVRRRDASSSEWADHVARQVRALLAGGVPPERIAVVGASKGAYIAALVSHAVEAPGVRYVILSMCDAETVAYMVEQGYDLHGDVLALRDAADLPELVGTCEPLFASSPHLGRHEEIVVHVGTGHGILYSPLDAWVIPTVQWARRPGS